MRIDGNSFMNAEYCHFDGNFKKGEILCHAYSKCLSAIALPTGSFG